MNLASLRIITADIKPLVAFYAALTGLTPTWFTDDFAEIATPSGTLAIGSTRTLAAFGTALAPPMTAGNAVIIEFRVEDVDAAYVRLGATLTDLVQTPTTMPWGNRSLLCRDPDGNLVNLFTPVTPEARRKFGLSA